MRPTLPPLCDLEEIVLLVVIALGGEAYGVTVQQRIEAAARRRIALGSVYAQLDRLERRGYLRSAFGEATAQRGGRRKRMFEATPSGLRALNEVKRTRQRLWRAAETAEGRG